MQEVRVITDDKLAAQIEVWKKTVEVNQHFNDIELRIRNLFMTLQGALFGAVGFAYKEKLTFKVAESEYPLAVFLVAVAVILVFCFWFMDRLWYHRLLLGSVDTAIAIEQELAKTVPGIVLSIQIKNRSAFSLFGKKISSNEKIDIFYGSILFVGIFVAALLIRPLFAAIAITLIVGFVLIWHCRLKDMPR